MEAAPTEDDVVQDESATETVQQDNDEQGTFTYQSLLNIIDIRTLQVLLNTYSSSDPNIASYIYELERDGHAK